jgi:hypothetical protein
VLALIATNIPPYFLPTLHLRSPDSYGSCCEFVYLLISESAYLAHFCSLSKLMTALYSSLQHGPGLPSCLLVTLTAIYFLTILGRLLARRSKLARYAYFCIPLVSNSHIVQQLLVIEPYAWEEQGARLLAHDADLDPV